MLSRICISLTLFAFSGTIQAQTKPGNPPVKLNPQPAIQATAQKAAPPALNFKRMNSALEYAFVIDKPGGKHPVEGDIIRVNMISICNGRMLFSSADRNKGKPAEFSANKPNFKGDIIEPIMLMTPGDSIACLVDADVLFTNTKNKKPDFIKKGDKIQYFIKLVSIKPKEQVQKEQQEAFNKQIKEQMEKQKKEEAKTMAKDDKSLQDYFKQHNLNPVKTAGGMYYTLSKEGEGDTPKTGDTVVMNYTGTLMDGTKFDSNEDTAFHHVTPFEFSLGRGQVIKGWDEGVALLKKGSKATFYIPSPMAYGAQSRPGGGANPKGIPANSILFFDVELVNIKPQTATPTPAPAPSPVPVENQNSK